MWIRICQECGAPYQERVTPIYGGPEPSDAYKSRACRKCKSEALDYGSAHQDTCDVRLGRWADRCTCYRDEDSE
jgi:hypothetical protein